MFAAVVGHGSGRATPSLRHAPQRQSMEIVRRETIYRNRNAVQTNPATSLLAALMAVSFDGCATVAAGGWRRTGRGFTPNPDQGALPHRR